MTIAREIADALDAACKLGNDKDFPEGVRYIQVSVTLARQWATMLRDGEPRRRDEIQGSNP